MKRIIRKQSAETCKKRSEALKGRKMSEETKGKISEALKRYWEGIPYDNKSLVEQILNEG